MTNSANTAIRAGRRKPANAAAVKSKKRDMDKVLPATLRSTKRLPTSVNGRWREAHKPASRAHAAAAQTSAEAELAKKSQLFLLRPASAWLISLRARASAMSSNNGIYAGNV